MQELDFDCIEMYPVYVSVMERDGMTVAGLFTKEEIASILDAEIAFKAAQSLIQSRLSKMEYTG